MYRYQKGDYESMRAETLKFANERYFNGYSDTRSVQENFNLITTFIQESKAKHIPLKTSRSVSTDKNLSWNDHCQYASKKVSSYLCLLSKIRTYLSQEYRLLSYNFYIKPHFDY